MRPLRIQEIAAWTGGELIQGKPGMVADRLSTDTRTLRGGELFVALKGERFDAHDHLEKAIEGEAAALLVQRLPEVLNRFGGAILRVPDTLRGLQDLAYHYRRSLPVRVLGITGSSGKTSTKDLCRCVLQERFRVHATRGNLNNHFGVPLTLLELEPEHEVAVVEMGMNHAGEIDPLADLAGPGGAIITNVGRAHIEHLGSREAIALEKGMLAEAVPETGWVVLSAHDDFTAAIRGRCQAEVVTAGVETGDVQARDLRIDAEGCQFRLVLGGEEVAVRFPIAAEHMVRNAMLAAAAGWKWGMDAVAIARGLERAELTGGRLEVKELEGLRFLDDSYNANPDSMRAALRTLRDRPVEGRRIAVLGRMAELGEFAREEHRALGEAIAENGIDFVIGIGDEGQLIADGVAGRVPSQVFPDHGAIAGFLRENAREQDLILLKGSRAAHMETVLSHLSQRE